MGLLKAGLLGQVRNKVGNMVFSNWKGLNTARAYAVPANPDTPAQQEQRGKFRVVQALASSLLGTLIAAFWNPFAVKMSGYNAFISSFIANATSGGLVTTACLVTRGSLEGLSDFTAAYAPGSGQLELDWSTTIIGNGLATDKIGILVLREDNNGVVHYSAEISERDPGTFTASLPAGLTTANLTCFLFCWRGTGSSFIVSNSKGVAVTAA